MCGLRLRLCVPSEPQPIAILSTELLHPHPRMAGDHQGCAKTMGRGLLLPVKKEATRTHLTMQKCLEILE